MKRHAVAAILSIALVGAVAGCTAGAPPAAQTPTSTATATPRPTGAPGPAITECDDLVSPDAQKKYEAAGWAQSDDFVQRMTDQQAHLVRFVDYGGALCQWGFPNSDASDVFGGSAIDDAQETAERARLGAEGFTLDQHNGADRYTLVTNDVFYQIYLFTGGYWFYGSSESAADSARQFADVG